MFALIKQVRLLKANTYVAAINSLNKFIKALDKSKNIIIFQSKQSVLIKDPSFLREKNKENSV